MKMERMWRKVNQGLSGRSSKAAAMQSSDTASSAGFGDPQIVVAVAGGGSGPCGTGGASIVTAGNIALNTSSTPTGRRLATSGQQAAGGGAGQSNSFSQHVISTASSERRRKRRRKSRPRRNGGSGGGAGGVQGCGGGGGSERAFNGSRNDSSHTLNNVSGTPPLAGTTAMTTTTSIGAGTTPPPPPPPPPALAPVAATAATTTTTSGDPTLRQRAVAKLRMFNFHLNWDLHMTQCKPCGPRSSGNILTRRLCRNRRREDNELYRSNSFKFERFERKEGSELGADTLQKKIGIALFCIAMASADKLAGHYITAPSYAGTSGGSGNFLQSPHQSYLPPGQHFNQYGQPTSVHIGYGQQKPAYQQSYHHPQQPSYQQMYKPPQQPSYQQSYQPNRQHYGASLLKYESVNNGDGNYNFEYQTADGISRREEGHLRASPGGQPENVVTGSYSYTGPDGHLYSVTYTADSTGFHPVGDHLPTPPPIPEAIKQSLSGYGHGQYQQPSGGYSSGRPAAQYIPPNKYIPPAQQQYSGYRGYY